MNDGGQLPTGADRFEAPECRGCGRRMSVESRGYGNTGGDPLEVSDWVSGARCDCCPVDWSAKRGWEYRPHADSCEHVDFEVLEEECPGCGAPQLWAFLDLQACPACGWDEERDPTPE